MTEAPSIRPQELSGRPDGLEAAFPPRKIFIWRFDAVPMVDVSDVGALGRFLERCAEHGTTVLMSELNTNSRNVLEQMEVLAMPNVRAASGYDEAIATAAALLARPT